MLGRGLVLISRLPPAVLKTSTRNTVIVKRVHKPPLVSVGGRDPRHTAQSVIDQSVVHTDDDKYMVYNIEELYQEDHTVKVILLRNVDDYGVKGQIVTFPTIDVQRDLLLPGFAVYHSAENVEKYKDIIIPEDKPMNSSESARLFVKKWSKRVLDICMNMDNPWTIEKWHIKASLRKHHAWVEEENIEIPGGQISGPDLSLENKEFIAIVTVNNFERVKVRCRIHHHAVEPDRAIRLESWYFRPAEPVWEAERQQLLDMNKQPPSWRLQQNKKLEKELEYYKKWKMERENRIV